MKYSHFLCLAAIVAMSAVPAVAQEQAASAPKPAMAKSMSTDCGKVRNTRHDHSTDRGAMARSATQARPCPGEASASGTSKTTQKKTRHDHAQSKNL